MTGGLYPCTGCEVEVGDDVEALQCDLCSGWEHKQYIRECDRPSVQLYDALTSSPCKSILFVCSKCRCSGDVAHRLFQLENARDRANNNCQVAERLLRERQTLVDVLQVDKDALQKEVIRLQTLVNDLCRKLEAAQMIDESGSLPELLDMGDKEPLLKAASYEVHSKRVGNERTVNVK